MTTETTDADDLEAVRYWTCKPEILYLMLESQGVPMNDRKVWQCPCGGEECQSAVGYGIGPAPADAPITWIGDGPAPDHVLWVVPSTKYHPGNVMVTGIGPGETLDAVVSCIAEDDPLQARWYGLMLRAGLRDVLEAELATLGAS